MFEVLVYAAWVALKRDLYLNESDAHREALRWRVRGYNAVVTKVGRVS